MDSCVAGDTGLPPQHFRMQDFNRIKDKSYFSVEVEWDTGGKKVRGLSKIINFQEELTADIKADVLNQPEAERQEHFEYRINRALEETTDWLVAGWKFIYNPRKIRARVPKEDSELGGKNGSVCRREKPNSPETMSSTSQDSKTDSSIPALPPSPPADKMPPFVYADAMTRAIECSSATEEEKKRMLELYMQTREETTMDMIVDEFEFEPTLHDLADGSAPYRFISREDVLYCRFPTDKERKSLVHEGQTLRFPVAWTLEGRKFETYSIPEKQWKKGERWTMDRFLSTARSVYSKNNKRNLKAMGDHIYFEGIFRDGEVYTGS